MGLGNADLPRILSLTKKLLTGWVDTWHSYIPLSRDWRYFIWNWAEYYHCLGPGCCCSSHQDLWGQMFSNFWDTFFSICKRNAKITSRQKALLVHPWVFAKIKAINWRSFPQVYFIRYLTPGKTWRERKLLIM